MMSPLARRTVVAAFLAAFVALSVWEMRDQSGTYDEGPHLSAAYSALVLGDYRMVTEQPPLGRRIAAMALLGEDVHLPTGRPAWREAEHFGFGFAFLFQSGNRTDRILFRARLAMLGWGLLLLLSVYAVARELFGDAGGLLALAAGALNPNLLAHAHLVTVDVAAAALAFLAVVAFQRWLDAPTPWRSAAAGILAGGAVMAKLSMLVLGPVFAMLGIAHAVRFARERPPFAAAEPGARGGAVRWAAGLLVMAALVYATIWGAYGFRFATSPDLTYQATQHLQYGPQGMRGILAWIAAHRLLPEALLVGLTELRNHAVAGHWGFALGQYSREGWWWYLPFTFLVKNPVSWLALLVVGVITWARRRDTRAGWGPAFGLAALGITAFAMASPLAMGIRHLLPAFPFAMVACGAAWPEAATGRVLAARVAVGALAIGLAVECLAGSPYHLAYFNAPTVAAAPRHRVLLDSNLDWGQDLTRLSRWLDERGIRDVKLAYFGMASPRHAGIRHEILLPTFSQYTRMEKEWRVAQGIGAGDTVAVSAFLLDKLEATDALPPRSRLLAVIGHSIFVFQVTAPEGT